MTITIFYSNIYLLFKRKEHDSNTGWVQGQKQVLGNLNINLQERRPQGDPREPEYLSLLPAAYNSSIHRCISEQLGCMNVCY